jgi:hypothetical protein
MSPRARSQEDNRMYLTHYFTVSNDKIVSLIIISNTPVE